MILIQDCKDLVVLLRLRVGLIKTRSFSVGLNQACSWSYSDLQKSQLVLIRHYSCWYYSDIQLVLLRHPVGLIQLPQLVAWTLLGTTIIELKKKFNLYYVPLLFH